VNLTTAAPHLIETALAMVALETLCLLWFGRRLGLRPLDVIGQVGAGLLLLVAVRCALDQRPAGVVLTLVAASLPLHLFDLRRRAHGGALR
jgi:hypothetical protein